MCVDGRHGAAPSDSFDRERNGPTRGVGLSLWLKTPVVFCRLLLSTYIPEEPTLLLSWFR
jgi:hypothetical protein